MLNPFFLQGSRGEQGLVQDLINEQLKIYGVEVYYLPRRYVTEKTIMKEVVESEFRNAYPIEAYVDNYDDRLFEIKYVEHEQPFYQLKKNYVYELKCELYRYQDEDIDTDVEFIDDNTEDIGYIQTLQMIGAGSTATAITGIVNGGVQYVEVTNRGKDYLKLHLEEQLLLVLQLCLVVLFLAPQMIRLNLWFKVLNLEMQVLDIL